MSDHQIEVLQQIPILAGIGEEDLLKLCSLLENRTFRAGDVLVREGDLASEMYVVFEGRVRVERDLPGGDALQIATLGPGSCFGEMALIDIQPRSASVIAETDGELEVLHNMDFLTLTEWNINSFALIVMNIAREISRRLRGANKALLELTTSSESTRAHAKRIIPKVGRGVP